MAEHSSTSNRPLNTLDSPPGERGEAYALQSLCGEIIYIPHWRSVMRLLVTGKESDNAFALVGTGGSQGDPIGFHFHREAHDVFLCLKGQVNVWAGSQARTLESGDFASVPPGTVHRYQILGDHTEFIGLIVPGGWEDFFRFIGEPYLGPLWPINADRNPFEVLIPKLKAAAEKFDMVPQPQYPACEIQPWNNETDTRLPNSRSPYFLRAGHGTKYLADGTVVRPLATTKESAGRFSIGSVEGSSWHKNKYLGTGFVYSDVNHALQVTDGLIEAEVEVVATSACTKTRLGQGETLYIPQGLRFSIQFASRFARAYVFASGSGLIESLCGNGIEYTAPIIPEKETGAGQLSSTV